MLVALEDEPHLPCGSFEKIKGKEVAPTRLGSELCLIWKFDACSPLLLPTVDSIRTDGASVIPVHEPYLAAAYPGRYLIGSYVVGFTTTT